MSTKPRREAVAPTPEPPLPEREGRRRLPAEDRRAAILAEAAILFAEEGFTASTRALAGRVGISQAALYKHFPSKDAIIAALFEARASRRRPLDWQARLAATDRPLADRLGGLYAEFIGGVTGPSMRLFVRVGLDGYGQPARRGAALTASIFEPVIAALRREAGLPDLAAEPMRHEERETAMTLHGSLVFLAIRKHVYRMPMADDLTDLVRRQVRIWVPGAIEELRRLHEAPSEAAVPQLAPRR